MTEYTEWMQLAARMGNLELQPPMTEEQARAAGYVYMETIGGLPLWVKMDVDAAAVRERLTLLAADARRRVTHSEAKLASPFGTRAPQQQIEAERQRLNEARNELAEYERQLDALAPPSPPEDPGTAPSGAAGTPTVPGG